MDNSIGYLIDGYGPLDPDRYNHFDNLRMGQACARCEKPVYDDDDETICEDCEKALEEES